MKALIFSSFALAGLLLVGLQHQQLGQLRAENATLQQASAEANRLKADLDKSTGNEAQDEDEIARLREENHDLLKLRNEVNQLRDAKAEFQKVSAENQQLRSQPRNTLPPQGSLMLSQPIVINIDGLYDRGLNTPEATLQTFLWTQHEANPDAMSRCVTTESQPMIHDLTATYQQQYISNIDSIEIVARKEMDANTVQLGIAIKMHNSSRVNKVIYTFSLRNGEWRLDLRNL